MIYHLIPVTMAIIKKTGDKCWQGCGENKILVHCWWEGKFVQPLWKTVWRFFQKLKILLPYDPVIPYQKELKSESQCDICTPTVYCSIVHDIQDMGTT